ncbi:MAG: dihydroneopterin aldolase [Pseudomonadota bacterium]|nr:dihydroneopterin aldolase [Pseudomonadota bacterium]
MTDKIVIRNLRLRTIIGLNDWERKKKQDLTINIVIHSDLRISGHTDNIDDTVNYKKITKHIIALTESSKYRLLEALASHIASDIIKIFNLTKVEIKIDKPHALRFSDSVAVEIVRTKHDY